MNQLEKKILQDFDNLKTDLNRFGEFVDKEILDILSDPFVIEHKLKIHPKFRIKDDKSFISKALWRDKEYVDPMIDIEDKIGTRIILLTSYDVKLAAEIILKHSKWDAKETKNIDKIIEDKPEFFSYQSIHIVVTPKNTVELTYDNEVEKLTCEIQIRTLLQHAYAEVSHDSTYKGPYKNDFEIIRHLSKSMALMEATDDYFCNIFNMLTDNTRFYKNYTNELITLYKTVNTSYVNDIDKDLFDCVYALLDKKKVEISEISEFVQQNSELLNESIINIDNGLMYNQPIYLLIAFYFKNNRDFLKENWPFTPESLKQLFLLHSVSFD